MVLSVLMAYQSFESLEELHVEITNKCNASCPMCARNIYGGRQSPDLKISEWTQEDAQKIFSPQFKNLKNILFCGTHGDPAVAAQALEIVELAKTQTSATVEFYSNGSVRTPSWWAELAKIMKTRDQKGYYRSTDLCVFSIDGLEDTNTLYRRGTQFSKIIENASAYIKAGGVARWDFLVFKHNEHQVQEAKALSKKIGFSQFRLRKTTRFAYSPDGPEKQRVLNKKGDLEYYIEPPTQKHLVNKNKQVFDTMVHNMDQQKSPQPQIIIRCLNKTKFQRIYVNALKQVYPCCFISSDTFSPKSRLFRDYQEKVSDKYGWGFNSLDHFQWSEVLNHPWLKDSLESSWNSSKKQLKRCARTCSSTVDPITSQSEDL